MVNNKKHILIVDDDDGIRMLLKEFLEQNKFIVSTAPDAIVAEQMLQIIKFNLIVLDIMMPIKTGLEFTKELKNKKIKTPIILLTAKGEVEDRITGLETGVDDYLAKPFEPRELVLRINNILNKISKNEKKENLKIGQALVNLSKMFIKKDSKEIKISLAEKNILSLMSKDPGKVFSRDEIGKVAKITQERSIDVIITRLRKKIEVDVKKPKYLQTIRGQGYVLWIE
jgi:two-component system phosphate regulon response regulator OmpR